LTLTMIRVVLVSEIRLHREGLASNLDAQPGIDVVAVSDSLSEAVNVIHEREVDIVLLDLPPTPEYLSALADSVAALPDARFVPLGVVETEEAVAWAEAGAAAFLEPADSLDELHAVLQSVMRGELRCSSQIAAALLRRVQTLSTGQRPKDALSSLTVRELEILQLIGEGLSNKDIAQRTSLRLPTVKNHVRRILQKLQVTSRAAAATIALASRRLPDS
jgi:two-component system NarL family response regulator